MKYSIKILFYFCLPLTFLVSCEKEVDIELHSVEPRLVIDASLGYLEPCRVQLTETKDYWDQTLPELISGATITLSDNLGHKETLVELDDVYISKTMGLKGRTYTLTVELDGEVYEATDSIPTFVPIDSIYLYQMDTGGDVHHLPCVSYRDPKGEPNYYLFILSINDNTIQETKVESDKNSDGLLNESIIFYDKEDNNDEKIKVGDVINIRMQMIGKGAFKFYDTLKSPGGMSGSNPTGNFSGNALGMFKTYMETDKTVTLTEEHFIK